MLGPKLGFYKRVMVIDGNSLYASTMSRLGIFIYGYISSTLLVGMAGKLHVSGAEMLDEVEMKRCR